MKKKLTPVTEQYQHFVEQVKESFWGEVYEKGKQAVKELLELDSQRQRQRYLMTESYERTGMVGRDYRNGSYERDLVTRFGTIRIRVARTRQKGFLPGGVEGFQRRAEEVALLIREAFLRGISTRQVGRVIGVITGEVVSAQTVSKITQSLDQMVRAFHQQRLADEWRYLFLDGVSLRVRRPGGRKRVQLLVAYGVRADGSRQLLAFMRSQGESQAAWEGLLEDLYRRGLEGQKLKLIVTDGCAGLQAALQTVYPRVAHQRCWVHKMRNLVQATRKRDVEALSADAQAIYRAASLQQARRAFERFRWRWQACYPSLVHRLETDLPDLLTFYQFPKSLWKKLRTTNVIERRFVEVRRRTRPMVCFVNIHSVDRIIFAIFSQFNQQWGKRTLRVFTQAA
ncbi:MAG: IS256 family transposase [Terriglobia bacterium]